MTSRDPERSNSLPQFA